jgi:hypothetical protein
MTELKVPVVEILKWNDSAACFFCGIEARSRPEFQDWTVSDGRVYCPECAAREAIH